MNILNFNLMAWW